MNSIPWGRIVRATEQELRDLLFPHAILSPREIADRSKSPEFRRAAGLIARHMIFDVSEVNARTWREAAVKSSNGRKIFRALHEELSTPHVRRLLEVLVRENARVIRSMPISIARQLATFTQEQTKSGKRAGVIAAEIREMAPYLTENKIQLVARTQVGISESGITRIRAQEIGSDWFVWETSLDSRVRFSHQNMNGVLVNWNDLPSPEALVHERDYGVYAAGATFNCRCVGLPLISLDEVKWPCRVFSNRRITVMTRDAFARKNRYPLAA